VKYSHSGYLLIEVMAFLLAIQAENAFHHTLSPNLGERERVRGESFESSAME
jgi:hypothetical protein